MLDHGDDPVKRVPRSRTGDRKGPKAPERAQRGITRLHSKVDWKRWV